jgi:xanthine/uracil permease
METFAWPTATFSLTAFLVATVPKKAERLTDVPAAVAAMAAILPFSPVAEKKTCRKVLVH